MIGKGKFLWVILCKKTFLLFGIVLSIINIEKIFYAVVETENHVLIVMQMEQFMVLNMLRLGRIIIKFNFILNKRV